MKSVKALTDTFYRDLLDNLYDGIYFVDREREITYWNKEAERITGYSQEKVLGPIVTTICYNMSQKTARNFALLIAHYKQP
jgi:PAS domain S-box-containing protein